MLPAPGGIRTRPQAGQRRVLWRGLWYDGDGAAGVEVWPVSHTEASENG